MHIETPGRRTHSISLTPLIDVVFILLVFFMLATSFTDWRPITLATATQTEKDQKSHAVVHVDASGDLHYKDNDVTDTAALAHRLRRTRKAGDIAGVVVQPTSDARLGVTVQALDRLSGAGLEHVSLAIGTTEPRS